MNRIPVLIVGFLLMGACIRANDQLTPMVAVSPTVVNPPASCTYHHAANGAVLPDPACTPGVTNPDVTQANIASTICKRGWTSTVRPPVSVTEPQKIASMRQYGATGPASGYEYDHLISLELGGAVDDLKNMWPEAPASPNPKDSVENQLNRLVCSGAMSLADAQQRIALDWTTAVP